MDLTREQTAAAMHGLGKKKARWEPLELTDDQLQPVPDWLGDCYVDWHEGCSNTPTVRMKQVADFPEFGNWRREDGGRWIQRSSDGLLMHQHIHKGALSMRPDGSIETTKQDGYAGRTFTLERVEGLCDLEMVQPKPLNGLVTVHLQGPWFGGCPDGWIEMISVDMRPDPTDKYSEWSRKWYDLQGVPWYRRSGTFGFYLSETVVVRALRKFQPHLLLARAWHSWSDAPHVEPYTVEWGAPKAFKQMRVRGEGPGEHPEPIFVGD